MNPCDFLYYADYYAKIARAGINSAQAVFDTINIFNKIDYSTFDDFTNIRSSVDDMNFAVRNSYEQIFSNMYSTNFMQTSFLGLSKHVLKTENKTINEFVEFYGLEVLPTYASISNVFGNPIDSSNIRDEDSPPVC